MCTPLMAQRWLLHHAALATGFACSPRWSAAPAACELTGEEWDELIALGIAKDNGGDVFNVLVHAYAPALHLRGNTLISGCWAELWWTCKKTLVTVLVWSEAFPGSSSPHENKYGHFISMAARVSMCWNAPQTSSRPDRHPRHIGI